MKPKSYNLKIKDWALEDRPREKLLSKGKSSLSEAELLGILIGSGTKDISAVDLAKVILGACQNNLNRLARKSVTDLVKFKGIGKAKAINIVSALELGRRRSKTITTKLKINSSSEVFETMKSQLLDLSHEEFWILLLDRANQVIHKQQISSGGISGTVADTKLIFKHALDHLASSIILVHNHPSGNQSPSKADEMLTQKLKKAGDILDIPVLDHIIFTDNGYFSFADENMI